VSCCCRIQADITDVLKDIAGHKAGQKLLQKARKIAQADVTDAEQTATTADLLRQSLVSQVDVASAVVRDMVATAAALKASNSSLPVAIGTAKQERLDAFDDARLVEAELEATMKSLQWGFAATEVDETVCELSSRPAAAISCLPACHLCGCCYFRCLLSVRKLAAAYKVTLPVAEAKLLLVRDTRMFFLDLNALIIVTRKCAVMCSLHPTDLSHRSANVSPLQHVRN
jgi:hypothetical protein